MRLLEQQYDEALGNAARLQEQLNNTEQTLCVRRGKELSSYD